MSSVDSQRIGSHVTARQALSRESRARVYWIALLLLPAYAAGRALRSLWRRIASPEVIAGKRKDNQKMKNKGAAASPKTERQLPPNDSIVEHYEKQLQELRSEIEAGKREKGLLEAWESRELMATLREEGWLGLRLLAHLRSSAMPVSELVSSSGMGVDCVAATAARLYKFGAADLQNRSFTCTDEGRKLLQNIEAKARVDLTPEPESTEEPESAEARA